MKTLSLFAHGSRREASNDEVRQLTRRLNVINPLGFSGVETAFLELAQSSIPEDLAACLANANGCFGVCQSAGPDFRRPEAK